MSAPPLTDKAAQLLEMVPGYWREEPFYTAMVDAMSRELQRVQDAADAVRLELFPQNATDTYGLLGMWEAIYGLPVAPAGLTVGQRQSAVLARFRTRQAASGADWVNVVAALLGTGWSYAENTAIYRVTITVPAASGSLQAYQIEQLLREATPANLEIAVVHSEGFQVGLGLIGLDRI